MICNKKAATFTPIATPISLALSLACTVFPLSAAAQQADTTLPDIKVSGEGLNDFAPGASSAGAKIPTPLRDIPQSVTVINRSVLDTQAATSLAQALRNVPGITISAGEGGSIGDNINLRGFSARTDVYLDGFRDRGQYTRDTFSLDAVEVLKGPSSMLFGRGSTGGVINQISKKPELKPRTEAAVGLGNNDYYRTTLDVNRPLSDTSAFRIAAFGQDTQSSRDVVQNKDWGIAPSLRLEIAETTEATISALVQRNRDLPDYGFPFVTTDGAGTTRKPVDAPASRFYGYLDDHFNQSVDVVNATIKHKLNNNLTLRNQTQYSHYVSDAAPSPLGAVTRSGGGTPSLNDPLTLLKAPRQDRDRNIVDKSLFNQTDLIAQFQTGSVLHTLTTGLEVGRDKYDEDRYVWNTSAAAASINLGSPANGTRQGDRVLSRSVETSADTLAAYINDQIDLNKQWKLVGGLRWDRYKASSDLDKFTLPASFAADTTLASPPKTDTMVSPRAGVIYQPTETQSYYASYGTSFNPSAEAVNQSATNASLDPEKNSSKEIGGKLDLLDGNLTLNGALFRIDKSNARFRDGLGSVQVLGGEVRVNGVEVGVAGRIAPAWQVFGGYSWLDGKIVSSPEIGTGTDAGIAAEGKTYQNTPRNTATVWTTYRMTPEWEVGGGALYSAKRYVNNYETAQVDGYTRYDATVAYLQKAYDVRLNLQNLTNANYFEVASAGRATPVAGRAVIVTLAYRF